MKSQPRKPAGDVTTERLEDACRQRGLPVTIQRRAIFETLVNRDDHPTAEQTYDAARSRLPGVSRATVYRTLETLAKLGVIHRVSHAGDVTRFDAHAGRHDHLVCVKCGRISDVEPSTAAENATPRPPRCDFEVLDYSIQFRGICSSCREDCGTPRRKKHGNTR